MYKLSTLSDSCSGRYPEGPMQPSDLRRTFACPLDSLRIPEPSASFEDHRSFGVTFGLRESSVSSEDFPPHHLTFGRKGDLRAMATFGTFGFGSCSLGQPPVCAVVIPNSSPSRARADSDGPNPRSFYHLHPKKRLPPSEVGTSRR